jgi:ribosome-associated toxin RatA of RatAB toxin-antitoxin module
MTRISRSALLPYPAAAMFDLVNDIASYPQFLPGCLGATVHSAGEQEVTASLELGKAGLRYALTTRNELERPQRMRMHLLNGPFRSFSAEWQFTPLAEQACKVSLDMHFEFSAGLLDAALGTLFESTARELVNAICARAEQLYGKA